MFAPTDAIMYPKEPKYLSYVTIEGSDEISEGAARPGFFRGVATVVTKLFNIIQPTKSYFGQKDGLQAIMVQQFVRDLNIPVQICVCPIVRAVGFRVIANIMSRRTDWLYLRAMPISQQKRELPRLLSTSHFAPSRLPLRPASVILPLFLELRRYVHLLM